MPFLMEEGAGQGLEAFTEEECFERLRRGSIGRVALSISGTPAVFPVNYLAVDGAIYFMSGEGMKLEAARRKDVVAFQIDQFDTLYHHGWSVLAIGVASVVEHPQLVEKVLKGGLQPWAPGHRCNIIRIALEFASGRRITFHPTG
jgi:uncharacterized protein